MEKHAGKQSPSRIEELIKIFVHATKVSRTVSLENGANDLVQMEVGFWRMASKP